MRKALKIIGFGIAIPAALLVLWAAWNLRHSFVSVLLICIPVVAGVAATKWAFRTRKAVTIVAGGTVLLTTRLLLRFVTDQFGVFTWFLVYLLFSLSLIGGLILLVGTVRALIAIGPIMREIVAVVGCLAVGFLLLGTLAWSYSTDHGYNAWYFMLPTGRLTVGGKPNSGYVHWAAGNYGRDVVVTVRQPWKGETYWILLPDKHRATVSACKDAPRFPLFAIGDVDYSVSEPDDKASPSPPDRNLLSGATFVEFTADDGKRVRAEW